MSRPEPDGPPDGAPTGAPAGQPPGASLTETAASLLHRLRAAGETLSVAESCTGGLLGEALTSVPGASDVFWGGVVAYHDQAKVELLGIDPGILERMGAVSEQVARLMAAGIRRCARTTWGVAITGIAGPGGGTPEKPVGTVWLAVDGPDRRATDRLYRGDRATIRRQAAGEAMELVAAVREGSPTF